MSASIVIAITLGWFSVTVGPSPWEVVFAGSGSVPALPLALSRPDGNAKPIALGMPPDALRMQLPVDFDRVDFITSPRVPGLGLLPEFAHGALSAFTFRAEGPSPEAFFASIWGPPWRLDVRPDLTRSAFVDPASGARAWLQWTRIGPAESAMLTLERVTMPAALVVRGCRLSFERREGDLGLSRARLRRRFPGAEHVAELGELEVEPGFTVASARIPLSVTYRVDCVDSCPSRRPHGAASIRLQVPVDEEDIVTRAMRSAFETHCGPGEPMLDGYSGSIYASSETPNRRVVVRTPSSREDLRVVVVRVEPRTTYAALIDPKGPWRLATLLGAGPTALVDRHTAWVDGDDDLLLPAPDCPIGRSPVEVERTERGRIVRVAVSLVHAGDPTCRGRAVAALRDRFGEPHFETVDGLGALPTDEEDFLAATTPVWRPRPDVIVEQNDRLERYVVHFTARKR